MKRVLILLLLLIISCSKEPFKELIPEETCEKFNYPPVDLDKVAYILPMGGLSGIHVAPIDHQYYMATDFFEQKQDIEVYAPTKGVVRSIQHMGSFLGDGNLRFDDYHLTITHDCQLTSVFIHLDELSPKLKEVAPEFGGYKNTKVKVQAGEIIGSYRGSIDYNIVDEKITIGLINPDSYKNFEHRMHIPDPFPYFDDAIKEQLITKCLRTAKPEGGYIDYDKDGTLLGTWFKQGTNGWDGLTQERYWVDHLAIVYNNIDPEQVQISFGTYEDESRQFCVGGNQPDPAAITKDSGLIVYELVDCDYFNGENRWDRNSLVKNLDLRNNDEHVNGVVLVQLVEDRKLKLEAFPGKNREDVKEFVTPDFFVR